MAELTSLTAQLSLDSGEALLWSQPDVTLVRTNIDSDGDAETIGELHERGAGTLYVTARRVVWIPAKGSTFEFEASTISMHAISREGTEEHRRPCVYIQLDGAGLPAEVYFSPADSGCLEQCFRAFAQTSLLNPPAEEDESGCLAGMGEGGDFDGFYGEVDDELITGGGNDGDIEIEPSDQARAAMLAHLDSILHVPDSLVAREDQVDPADFANEEDEP